MSAEVRKAIYALAVAVLGVAAVYGLFNEQQVESIVAVLAAAVNLLAFVNTPVTGRHSADNQE